MLSSVHTNAPNPAGAAPADRAAHPFTSGALRRNLRASLIDGAAVSIMTGIGEVYLPAFVLAIDPRAAVSSGLVASIPLLAGTIIQLRLSALVRRLGSVRRAVVLTAVIQALTFLPLMGSAMARTVPVITVFAL